MSPRKPLAAARIAAEALVSQTSTGCHATHRNTLQDLVSEVGTFDTYRQLSGAAGICGQAHICRSASCPGTLRRRVAKYGLAARIGAWPSPGRRSFARCRAVQSPPPRRRQAIAEASIKSRFMEDCPCGIGGLGMPPVRRQWRLDCPGARWRISRTPAMFYRGVCAGLMTAAEVTAAAYSAALRE